MRRWDNSNLHHNFSPFLWLIGLLLIVGFTSSSTAQNQQEIPPLTLNQPVERELVGGQSHSYQLTLAAGQYLHVVTEQRGIDVVVVLLGPDGKKLIEVDSPNGTQGPEPLKWITESGGIYRLEVRSLEKDAKAGRYEVKIVDLRAATEADKALIEAFSLASEVASLRGKGKLAEAIPLAERVLNLREKAFGPNHADVADSLHTLAELYYYKGDYVKAEAFFQRVLEIREKTLGPNHPDVASSLNNLAVLYDTKGDYEKAEPLLQRALLIREQALGPSHPDVAYSLNGLAALHHKKGDYAGAEPLFQRALEIREKALGPNHPDVATSLNNLAMLYVAKGDYAKAGPFFQRALTIREKTLAPNHPYVALSLNSLATFHHENGDYARAEPLLQRALVILEQTVGPNHPDVAASLNRLAMLYRAKGDYAKAESLYQRALTIREKALGPNHPDVADVLNNLAVLYDAKNDYVKAESLYQQALTIRENVLGPNHPNVANSLNNFAAFHHKRGDYTKAELLYQQALTIRENVLGPYHPSVANSLTGLAELHCVNGNYAKAEPLFQRSLAVLEQAFGPNHSDVADTLYRLAVLYRDQGNAQQGIAVAARATEVSEFNLNQTLNIGSERQKLLFLALQEGKTNFILALHTQSAPNDSQALKLALTMLLRRKGRGLESASDVIATLRRRASPQDQPLFDQLTSTRSQLATLTLRGRERTPTDQFRAQLKQLADDADKLEADLSSRSAEFRAQTQAVTIETIQAALPKNGALVEFATYRPFNTKAKKNGPLHYVAYTLAAQDQPRWVELGEAAPIDGAVAALRQALRSPQRADVKRLARVVDQKVMQPVRTLLGQTRRVLLAPDGPLNLVPFAALVDERGRYLVEQYSISYLTSGRDLLRLQTQAQSQREPLVIADPDFGEQIAQATKPAVTTGRAFDLSKAYFSPLPGTAEEAGALKALLPKATMLTRAQATEAALKAATSPRLLHIATHGFFLEDVVPQPTDDQRQRLLLQQANPGEALSGGRLENPLLRSGLGLAGANLRKSGENDGILTALEAAGLNLWGTKLVVLSACDTGVGEVKNGDGVYGLRRALVLAGSESQVMSLWPVSDHGTRDLMIAYYRRLQAGAGRSEGLRQVQLQMLRNPKRQHPYYWASFIQSGEWANLQGQR